MNIKTKFNIGDTAFIIKYKAESYQENCSMCNGTGVVHIQETGAEIPCPSCHGKGTNLEIESTYYKEECKIYKISTISDDQESIVLYDLLLNDGSIVTADESVVFTSKNADKIIETNDVPDHVFKWHYTSMSNTARINDPDKTVGYTKTDIPKKLY